MKQVYPQVRKRRLGTREKSRNCYAGLRKRIKEVRVSLGLVKSISFQTEASTVGESSSSESESESHGSIPSVSSKSRSSRSNISSRLEPERWKTAVI